LTLFEDTESPAAPSGPLVRVRMTVAYDGSGFHGFAPNPGVRTVAGTLREAIERALRSPIELTCAGRTDTGVHAWGQVVSFDAPAERFDPLALQRSVNRQCGPAIVVRDLGTGVDTFDARRSAQPAGPRPVPGPPGLARRRPARPRPAAPRL
jgi:tRNA pseudouridine38-40 synthase